MQKYFALTVAVILLLAAVIDSLVVANETQFVVITRFGKAVNVITEPGLYLKWFRPFESANVIDQRIKLTDGKPIEFLTQDKKNLVITPYTVWQVKDPMKFLEAVRTEITAAHRLSDLVTSELVAKAAYLPLSAYISVEEGEVKLERLLQEVSDSAAQKAEKDFGISVLDVKLRRLTFPDQNLRHVFNRMRAERQRIAKKYRAEGEEKAMRIEAETDKEVRGILAQAEQEAAEIKGKADAEAISIYSEAFSKDKELYTFLRSLEAYQSIMDSSTTVILSTDSPLLKHLEVNR